jgi:hypothetical protein
MLFTFKVDFVRLEAWCDKLRRGMVKGKGFDNFVGRPHIIVADTGQKKKTE